MTDYVWNEAREAPVCATCRGGGLRERYEEPTVPVGPLDAPSPASMTFKRMVEPCDCADGERVSAAEWQPIETAPLDGSLVDLWAAGRGRLVDCFWYHGAWAHEHGYPVVTRVYRGLAPTHWRRAPAAPEPRYPLCAECGGRHAETKPGMCSNPGGPLDPNRTRGKA